MEHPSCAGRESQGSPGVPSVGIFHVRKKCSESELMALFFVTGTVIPGGLGCSETAVLAKCYLRRKGPAPLCCPGTASSALPLLL